MGADMLAENTAYAPEFIYLPKPKILDFNEKRLHWAFVVRDWSDDKNSLTTEVMGGVILTFGREKLQNSK